MGIVLTYRRKMDIIVWYKILLHHKIRSSAEQFSGALCGIFGGNSKETIEEINRKVE